MPLSQLKPRSDSALVRNMLADIEKALDAGASREAVWKMLGEEEGLSIGFDGFCKALWRARRAKGGQLCRATSGLAVPVSQPVSQPVCVGPGPGAGILPDDVEGATCTPAGGEPRQPPAIDAPATPRIRTRKDFEAIHRMDFNELDPKFR